MTSSHAVGALERIAAQFGIEIDQFDDGDCGYVGDGIEAWGFPNREAAALAGLESLGASGCTRRQPAYHSSGDRHGNE